MLNRERFGSRWTGFYLNAQRRAFHHFRAQKSWALAVGQLRGDRHPRSWRYSTASTWILKTARSWDPGPRRLSTPSSKRWITERTSMYGPPHMGNLDGMVETGESRTPRPETPLSEYATSLFGGLVSRLPTLADGIWQPPAD